MENKTLVIGALIVGAIIFVVLARGGGGSGLKTIAPLPSGDEGGKAQAFSDLIGLGRAELESARDLALARIQGGVENNRIAAAERASLAESANQLSAARSQASAQKHSDVWDFLGNIATVAIPAILGGGGSDYGGYGGGYPGGVAI